MERKGARSELWSTRAKLAPAARGEGDEDEDEGRSSMVTRRSLVTPAASRARTFSGRRCRSERAVRTRGTKRREDEAGSRWAAKWA